MRSAFFTVALGKETIRLEVPTSEAELVLGRAPDCALVVPAGAVSRRHARLRWRGDDLLVEDLGSSNGTFVNGERLSAPRALRDGDKLGLGEIVLALSLPAPAVSPAADATIAIPPGGTWPPAEPAPSVVPPAPGPRIAPPPPSPPPTVVPAPPVARPSARPEPTPTRPSPPPAAPPAPAPAPPAAKAPPPAAPSPPAAKSAPATGATIREGAGAGALIALGGIFVGAALGVFAIGAVILHLFF